MLHDKGGESSQGIQERGSWGIENVIREWKETIVSFLVDMCANYFGEYDRKPFK